MNAQEKVLFLTSIKERKDVIFGKFSNEISREQKIAAWKDITRILNTHDVSLAREKPYTYFRDLLWPNLRRYTMEKRDKRERTGEDGGRQIK